MRKGEDADVLVVGAGVFGLSVALALARTGRRVIVAERARPGAGASGGPVGALAPHGPAPWSAQKAFQRDALVTAEAHWREVAAASGIAPGYARIGRLMPLTGAGDREQAERHGAAAARHWPAGARWRLLAPDALPPWLAPAAAPAGAVHETLSARLAPRRAVAALAAALVAAGGAVRAGWAAEALEPGVVRFAGARTLRAGVVVASAGVGTGALLAPLLGPNAVRGVKGQALRLRAALPQESPLIGGGGLWIVPHADGTVALGSTSEAHWTQAGPDRKLDTLLAWAASVCPALAGAEVLERWAGVRPRAATPEPVLGALPGLPGLMVATGGYKTGFAVAHVIARLAVRLVEGKAQALPPGVTPAARLVPPR